MTTARDSAARGCRAHSSPRRRRRPRARQGSDRSPTTARLRERRWRPRARRLAPARAAARFETTPEETHPTHLGGTPAGRPCAGFRPSPPATPAVARGRAPCVSTKPRGPVAPADRHRPALDVQCAGLTIRPPGGPFMHGANFSPRTLRRRWSRVSEWPNEGEWSQGPSGRMRG
jgi:hypothetical protein